MLHGKAKIPVSPFRNAEVRRHPEIKFSDLNFADDIALTLDSEAQNILSEVEHAATLKSLCMLNNLK